MSDFHKGNKPRPGDKVRATLPTVDGVLVAADGQGVQLRLDDGSIHHLPGADIHVLERADDPSKDLPGAIRRDPNHGTRVIRLEPKDPEFDKRYGFSITGTPWDCDEVDGWPVVDVVPGTPAAEAEKQPGTDLISRMVEARHADGSVRATGRVVGFNPHPMVTIDVDPDGDEILEWPAHMVTVLEPDGSRDGRYRVGRKNSRNIYRVDGTDHASDTHVGVMFDPDDGPRVAAALNSMTGADPTPDLPDGAA